MAKRRAKPSRKAKSRKSIPPVPAPSADEQTLLAAVIAHPDEDTPRLMYADWLQENGQLDRAEFIRAQIEASKFPPGDPAARTLRARVVKLAKKYRKRWCGKANHDTGTVGGFVRGFPAAVQFSNLKQFCDHAEELFSRHPIRVLYSHEFGEEAETEVASSPHFARLTGLGNSRSWGGSRVALMLQNPHLTNLRFLDLNNGEIFNGPKAARGIAAAKHLTNLLVLDLSGNGIEDEGLEALASAKHLSSLRALRLGEDDGEFSNDITAQGIKALARSRWVSLQQLILTENPIGDDGVKYLLKAKWIENLTELDLAFTGLEEDGLLAIARSRRLVNLRRLSILALNVSEAVGQAFLRSKWFPNLTELELETGAEDELPSKETQTALVKRFGQSTLCETYFVPSSVCWEDKVAWRMQTLTYEPPPPTEDCEVV